MTNEDIRALESKLNTAKMVRRNIDHLQNILLLYSGNSNEIEIKYGNRTAYINDSFKGKIIEILREAIEMEQKKLNEME